MVEDQARIVRSGSCAKRALLPDCDAVDLRAVTRDLTNTVTAVCSDTMSETFFAITNSNYALRVAVPSNVIDTASNDVVFTCKLLSASLFSSRNKRHTLCSTLANAVPYSY